MAGISISSASLQYVLVPVRAFSEGVAYNPTGDTVQMAFMVAGTPGSADWKTASWAADTQVNGVYLAQCLIGPGGTGTLAIGSYTIWLKVVDNPEIPVLPVGGLTVTP